METGGVLGYIAIVFRRFNGVDLYFCYEEDLLGVRDDLKNKDNQKKIIKELIDAIDYLHSHNYAHRDIKIENILIDKKLDIKLCDGEYLLKIDDGGYNSNSDICGTELYFPPEFEIDIPYNWKKVDIWSLGFVLLVILSCGYIPEDINEIHLFYGNIQI